MVILQINHTSDQRCNCARGTRVSRGRRRGALRHVPAPTRGARVSASTTFPGSDSPASGYSVAGSRERGSVARAGRTRGTGGRGRGSPGPTAVGQTGRPGTRVRAGRATANVGLSSTIRSTDSRAGVRTGGPGGGGVLSRVPAPAAVSRSPLGTTITELVARLFGQSHSGSRRVKNRLEGGRVVPRPGLDRAERSPGP